MSYTSNTDSGTKPAKASWLFMLMISFVALFAVGCGDSQEDYVFTGNNGNVGTGAVTFQFVRAQATVPAGTESLHFEFFDASGITVFTADSDFANTVTVSGVPTTAVAFEVTARTDTNPNGIPLAVITGTVQVVAGGTTNATFTGSDIIGFNGITVAPESVSLALNGTRTQQLVVTGAFDNGESFIATSDADFTSSNPSVATVSNTGLVTAVAVGTTTITASYEYDGQTFTDTTTVTVTAGGVTPPPGNVFTASPTAVTLTNASPSQRITTTLNGAAVNATGTFSGFTGNVTASNLTYTGGNVTATGSTVGTANLNLTYTPTGGGAAQNATVVVTVNQGPTGGGVVPPPVVNQARLNVTPTTLIVAPGGTTAALNATFAEAGSNNFRSISPNASVTYSLATPVAGLSVDPTTGVVTAAAPAVGTTAQIIGQFNRGTTSATAAPVTVTVRPAAEANAVVSAEFVGIGDNLKLPSSSTAAFAVRQTTARGVTSAPTLTSPATSGYTVVFGNPAFVTAVGNTTTQVAFDAGAVAGTTTITLVENATGRVRDTINLELFAPTGTTTVALNPVAISVGATNTAPYTVVATYANGLGSQDLTGLWNATTSNNAVFTVNTPALVPTFYAGSVTGVAAGVASLTLGANAYSAGVQHVQIAGTVVVSPNISTVTVTP